MSVKYRIGIFILAAGFWLMVSAGSYAQMSQEELRRERVETLDELKRTQDFSGSSSWVTRGLARGLGWRMNFGGWYAPSYSSSDENDGNVARQVPLAHRWENDFRFFTNVASRSGKTQFYARMKATQSLNSTPTGAVRRRDMVGPAVDLLYLQQQYPAGGWKHQITLGRQFVMVERGISFGLTVDGLHYKALSRINEFQVFFARQNHSDDNIDNFSPGSGRTKRWFYGMEWKVKFMKTQTLDLFGLMNQDRNDESVNPATGQPHQLDSLYYGLGFEGRVIGNLRYWSMYIQESGKTYPSGGTTKVSISSSAIDGGLRYYFATAMAPSFYVEYAAGSGDGDAQGSANSSFGGSTAGKDERFISFGGLTLGYALAPQLTNIQVYKLGASVKPFGWSANRLWSDMSVQPKYYLYSRDKASG